MAVYLYGPLGKFGDNSWQPSLLTRPSSKWASEQSVRLSQMNHMPPFSLLYKLPLTQLLNFPQDHFFFICSMHSQWFCLSNRIYIRNNWKKWTKVNSPKECFCRQNSSSHQAASWLNKVIAFTTWKPAYFCSVRPREGGRQTLLLPSPFATS